MPAEGVSINVTAMGMFALAPAVGPGSACIIWPIVDAPRYNCNCAHAAVPKRFTSTANMSSTGLPLVVIDNDAIVNPVAVPFVIVTLPGVACT